MKTLILFSSSEIGGAEQSLSRLALEGNNKEFILGSLSGDGILLNNKNLLNLGVQKFGFGTFKGYRSHRLPLDHNDERRCRQRERAWHDGQLVRRCRG